MVGAGVVAGPFFKFFQIADTYSIKWRIEFVGLTCGVQRGKSLFKYGCTEW